MLFPKAQGLCNGCETRGGLQWWSTPLGEVATTESEVAEHIQFLVQEVRRNVYLSGPVRVAPGAVVLDVGANIGLFSRQAIAAGASRVIAVEPGRGNLQAFEANLAREIAAGHVSVLPKGAWNECARLTFTIVPTHPARSSFVERVSNHPTEADSTEVEPLDRMVEDLRLRRVDFLKMDIEGAEQKALEGAADLLRRWKPQMAVAVEHTDDWLANAKSVRDLVLEINPAYRFQAGPFVVTRDRRLAPEVVYFY